MELEIVEIRRVIDENEMIRGYIIGVESKTIPDLKLGKCKITQ